MISIFSKISYNPYNLTKYKSTTISNKRRIVLKYLMCLNFNHKKILYRLLSINSKNKLPTSNKITPDFRSRLLIFKYYNLSKTLSKINQLTVLLNPTNNHKDKL